MAERRCEYAGKHVVRNGAALLDKGNRRWTSWDELWVADDDFSAVGEDFAAATGLQRSGRVAGAHAQLVPMRDLVDFATGWCPSHRDANTFAHDTTAW